MQHVRGERFVLDLGDDETAGSLPRASASKTAAATATSSSPALVADVLERPAATSHDPPAPPQQTDGSKTGFPAHRKRTRTSRFKQQQRAGDGVSASAGQGDQLAVGGGEIKHSRETFEAVDRARIDQENRDKLDSMSSAEIESERQELFSGLSPALIQRLLQRSTLDEAPLDRGLRANGSSSGKVPRSIRFTADGDAETAAVANPAGQRDRDSTKHADEAQDDPAGVNLPEHATPSHEDEATRSNIDPHPIHFPTSPKPPDLDPNSPTFLADLHAKYFPDLSHDPAKLSWMQPASSSADDDNNISPYHPSHASLPPSALRFDFRGRLLPPRLARQISPSAGLHHHGDAPEAAGYTLPELARLARSSNAPQRCIAFQTLGRILYRLGRGEFGAEDDGSEEVAALSRGLWECVEETRVVQILALEAAREGGGGGGGHVSARAHAQEALWNWRRGGGRKSRAR